MERISSVQLSSARTALRRGADSCGCRSSAMLGCCEVVALHGERPIPARQSRRSQSRRAAPAACPAGAWAGASARSVRESDVSQPRARDIRSRTLLQYMRSMFQRCCVHMNTSGRVCTWAVAIDFDMHMHNDMTCTTYMFHVQHVHVHS